MFLLKLGRWQLKKGRFRYTWKFLLFWCWVTWMCLTRCCLLLKLNLFSWCWCKCHTYLEKPAQPENIFYLKYLNCQQIVSGVRLRVHGNKGVKFLISINIWLTACSVVIVGLLNIRRNFSSRNNLEKQGKFFWVSGVNWRVKLIQKVCIFKETKSLKK